MDFEFILRLEETRRRYIKANKPHKLKPWKDLWKAHEGKSFFVIASGPSCNLIDIPAEVKKADVVIGVNWIYNKFPDIKYDYLVACEIAPLFGIPKVGGMPSIKTIGLANSDGGRKEREWLRAYAAAPHFGRKEWVAPEKGKPLGSSMNSGFAALNVAAYMGAKKITVIGMDFTDIDGHNFHCYDDTALHRGYKEGGMQMHDAYKRSAQVDALKRVDKHLQELLGWTDKNGIIVENLSVITLLNFKKENSDAEYEVATEVAYINPQV